ncbi:MAG TPA: LysR family transcriptional regulator [Chloroflexota bacterium]|nr:LysR family transcriptional regulator [Chloroflexota bacterium]
MSLSPTDLHILASLLAGRTLAEIGEEMYLTQSAVSRALRLAEQKSGVQLLERYGRRLRLTPAGIQIAEQAQDVLAQLSQIDRLLDEMQSGRGGRLRLISSTAPGNYVVPVAVGEFLRLLPGAEVELRVLPPSDMWQTFLDEGYDMAIGPIGVGPQPVDRGDLAVEALYEDELVFFVAPGSPLADKPDLHWDELRSQTLVGPFGEPLWPALWEHLTHHGFTAARRVSLLGLEGVKLVVEAGGGVGVLFGAAVRDEIAAGRLIPLRISDLSLPLSYYLVTRRLRQPRAIVDQFRGILVRSVRQGFPVPTQRQATVPLG